MTRIADAVHGTVYLDDCETAVISTRAYQRLRGVKQLGLASLVFPGADYSRFAHGIGTFHVTRRILDSLSAAHPNEVADEEKRLYSMAALLHDVGHYPFSHTFERALNDFYTGRDVLKKKATSPADDPTGSAAATSNNTVGERWVHEELGRHLILEDESLRSVLDEYRIDAEALTQVIERHNPPRFANLVSSDLDADRIDYLLRTAKHTGLPYGNVDLDYLLSQICLDAEQHICIRPKGLRAAEHVLLCRYFDYQQVNFHKTVAGLELVLNDAIGALLRSGTLSITPADLQNMIMDGNWYSFDDARIISLMRQSRASGEYTPEDKLLFSAILDRNPPKLIVDRERLGPDSTNATLRTLRHTANQRKAEWESKFGIRFYIWQPSPAQLTKMGANVPASVLEGQTDSESYDRLQQSIRILVDNGTSKPIQECGNSLLSVLSSQALYSIRIYALIPPGQEDTLPSIQSTLNDDLGPSWKNLFDD